MLRQRALSALALVPPVLAAVWFGEPWFTALVAVAALEGFLEFARLGRAAGGEPFLPPGLVLTFVFVLSPHSLEARILSLLVASAVVIPLVWALVWALVQTKREGTLARYGLTLAGIFYLGWMLSRWVDLRGLDGGREWVLLGLLATFASDTAAFFVGRAFGRYSMASQVSPKKTWEGGVAGFLAAMLVAVGLAWWFALPMGYGLALLLGGLVAVAAQVGDLVESLLKRSAGVKDSGQLIPGHGGLLDRLDSIVFTGAVVYYFVEWMIK